MPTGRVAVRGSERNAGPTSSAIGVADPNEEVNVTVMVRRRAEPPLPGSHVVTREKFAELYGANPADVEQVEQFATEYDLTVTEVDLSRRSIGLCGTVANMSEAFG